MRSNTFENSFISLDDWASYGAELGVWLQRQFSPQVLERFHEAVVPTWIQWLDDQQSAVDGARRSTVALFERYLRIRYLGVRVVHATRLPDLRGIREHGIRAWSADELRGLAIASFPDLAGSDALSRAMQAADADHRAGRTYSFASLNHALGTNLRAAGRIPTFAALGGEYVGAVGNHARPNDKGESPQPGHGYFLACDLPWDLVEPAAVAYLVELLLSNAIVVSFLNTDRYNMFGSWEAVRRRWRQ